MSAPCNKSPWTNNFRGEITIPDNFPRKIKSITDPNRCEDPNGDPIPFMLLPVLEKDTLLNEVYSTHQSPRILPPLVVATSKKNGESYQVTINTYFSLDVEQGKEEIIIDCIRIKNGWDGTDFLPEFLIQVKYERNENRPANYKVYKLKYIIDFTVLPKQIITYVWKDDPEGSRGTETTVQDDDE